MRWYEYVSAVGEFHLHLGILPKLVDRDQCLGEAWHASNVLDDDEVALVAVVDHVER